MSDMTCQANQLGAAADGCENPVSGQIALRRYPDDKLYVCDPHAKELLTQLGDTAEFQEIDPKDVESEKELNKYRQGHARMRSLIMRSLKTPGWGVIDGQECNDGHPYVYTCGAWITALHAELIAFNMIAPDVGRFMGRLINTALDANTHGTYHTYQAGQDLKSTWPNGPPQFRLVEVSPEAKRQHFYFTGQIYEHFDFPALQLVWSDPEGRYPWMRGFDKKMIGMQPILGSYREPRQRKKRTRQAAVIGSIAD